MPCSYLRRPITISLAFPVILSTFSRANTGGRGSLAAVRWEGRGLGPLYAGREGVLGRCTLGGKGSWAAVRWEGGGLWPLYAVRERVLGRCTLGGRPSWAAVRF